MPLDQDASDAAYRGFESKATRSQMSSITEAYREAAIARADDALIRLKKTEPEYYTHKVILSHGGGEVLVGEIELDQIYRITQSTIPPLNVDTMIQLGANVLVRWGSVSAIVALEHSTLPLETGE